MPLRVGIVGLTEIGCGRVGRPLGGLPGTPHSHADAYSRLPETEVTAVCDLRPEAREQFAETWGDVWPNAARFSDHREMLAASRLDVLSVCTPDHAHAEIVVDACRAGVRGIFCEKPIATSLADADRMIAAASASGTVLSIDHTRRWRPLYLTARQLIREGQIGEVRRVFGSFCGPRAMLFRNGTHLIDTAMMLVDSEPEWVFAELDEGFEDYTRYRGDGGRDPGGDPGASGYLHFKNGARAFINLSRVAPSRFGFEVFGTSGRLTVTDAELLLHTPEGPQSVPISAPEFVDVAAGVQELVRNLDNPGELSCPPELGRMVLQVILGFLRSQELGNVRVPLADVSDPGEESK